MGLKIVTGRTGEPHVTSNQMQAFNRSLLGDLAILDVGQHFDAVVRDANTVRIYDGCIVVQGIYAIIPHDEFEDILVEPVSVGNTRIDTIYLHYAKDMESDTESVELDIAQGEEVVNNPVKPDIDAGGDTWEGTTDIRIPLYDVTVTSFETTITAYEYMDVYSPNISDLNQRIPETTVSGVKGDAESEYRGGNVNITPANIGLGNVDNTSDTDKPVSTAQQSALDEKVDKVTGKGLSTNDYTNTEKQKLADIESNAQVNVQSDWNEDDTEDDGYIKNKPDLSTSQTATGNPLTIESSESNLVECVAEVEAVQDLHGYDHPWVGGAGKNKLPMTVAGIKAANDYGTWSGNVYTINNVTLTILTDSAGNVTGIKANGTASDNTVFYIKINEPFNGNYKLNGCSGGSSTTYRLYVYIANYSTEYSCYDDDVSMALPSDNYRVTILIRSGATVNNVVFHPMIRLSTENDPTFAPYSNISPITGQTEVVITQKDNLTNPTVTKTYTIQLGDTIYGGELDVLTGELTVTHGEVDLGDLDWAYANTGNKYFYSVIDNMKYGSPNGVCSCYNRNTTRGEASTILSNGDFNTVIYRNYLYVRDDRYSDASTFKTAVTGQKLVYELAEPYTIQLTPQQIRLLKGTNHLSCNTGDLTIKYYPDNVLGQLKGDIEDEIDAVANRIKGVKTMQISGAAVSTDGSIMFTNLIGSIIVGTSISNDANSDKCVGIPYSMGTVPALKIMNESTMSVLSNIHISGILYYIEL